MTSTSSDTYLDARKQGLGKQSAHELAAQAYMTQYPTEPEGCYWCGDMTHPTNECDAEDRYT